MNEISVLVQPIYELSRDALLTCYNCSSTLFRVEKQWGIIKKEEFNKEEDVFRVTLYDVCFHCAVCGKLNEGFTLIEPERLEKLEHEIKRGNASLLTFDTKEEAEEWLKEETEESEEKQ